MFILEILKTTVVLFFEMAPYLMFGLLFVALLNLYFTKEIVLKYVGKDNFASVFRAALFGVPLPLCSCGVIPSSVYMAKNGASRSAVVSFLISTPQTGIDSIIATYGMLGPVFAIFRPFAAFFMGIFGGMITKYFVKTPDKSDNIRSFPRIETGEIDNDSLSVQSYSAKIKKTLKYSFGEFIDDISTQFITGLFIAGLITFFIPDDFFAGTGINSGIPGMLLMIAIGIPMYVCATASIPIAVSLMMKGFTPGVAFVFLAAGPATNAASLVIISKTLGKKTAIVFVGTIAVSSMFFGLLLDQIFLMTSSNPVLSMKHEHIHGADGLEWWEWTLGGMFAILLIMSFYRKFIKSRFLKKEFKMNEQFDKTINIEGMTCNHCVMNVQNAIKNTKGVESVNVDLNLKSAFIHGDFDLKEVIQAVESVGYQVTD